MEKPEQFKSRKEWEKFIWNKIIDNLVKAKSSDEVEQILSKLLGEHERKLMLRRLTAILLLREELSYSQIGEILWLSPNTISAIKKSAGSNQYHSWRKLAPGKGIAQAKEQEDESVVEKFLMNLGEYLAGLQKGYSDPKYRWRFLQK